MDSPLINKLNISEVHALAFRTHQQTAASLEALAKILLTLHKEALRLCAERRELISNAEGRPQNQEGIAGSELPPTVSKVSLEGNSSGRKAKPEGRCLSYTPWEIMHAHALKVLYIHNVIYYNVLFVGAGHVCGLRSYACLLIIMIRLWHRLCLHICSFLVLTLMQKQEQEWINFWKSPKLWGNAMCLQGKHLKLPPIKAAILLLRLYTLAGLIMDRPIRQAILTQSRWLFLRILLPHCCSESREKNRQLWSFPDIVCPRKHAYCQFGLLSRGHSHQNSGLTLSRSLIFHQKFEKLINHDICWSSVQGKLIEALKLSRLVPADASLEEMKFSRCGRTDSGVSARGQVRPLFLFLYF